MKRMHFFILLSILAVSANAQGTQQVDMKRFNYNGIPFVGAIGQDLDTTKYNDFKRSYGSILAYGNFNAWLDQKGNYTIGYFDFRKEGKITIDGEVLSATSTITDLQRIFPNGEVILESDDQTRFVHPTGAGYPMADEIHFLFHGGKLINFFVHTSC